MNTAEISSTLGTLLAELVDGASKEGGYMLNPGDEGLIRSLEKLSAADASALTATGSSIAAHVDHVRYGLSLMNRWSQGENPFDSADWSSELAQDRACPNPSGGSGSRTCAPKRRVGSAPFARHGRSTRSS